MRIKEKQAKKIKNPLVFYWYCDCAKGMDIYMLRELGTANTVVGVKQSRRAIQSGHALRAFIAEDADRSVVAPFIELCKEAGVETVMAPTMLVLGAACGIEVGAAVAVVLK